MMERYSARHLFQAFFVRLLSLLGGHGHSRLETITYPPARPPPREDKSLRD
jgi:hypothetical protein